MYCDNCGRSEQNLETTTKFDGERWCDTCAPSGITLDEYISRNESVPDKRNGLTGIVGKIYGNKRCICWAIRFYDMENKTILSITEDLDDGNRFEAYYRLDVIRQLTQKA